MRVSYATKGIALIECLSKKHSEYRVRWDIQDWKDGEFEGVSFMEEVIFHKPTLEEIKDIIMGWHNSKTSEKIVSKFQWKGMHIWLTIENQMNYKTAYDLAVQTDGKNLPYTCKFGDMRNPQYYTFTTFEDLQDFYLSMVAYINDAIKQGWEEKDSFDWQPYVMLLEQTL